jgi:hypothetical protein
MKKKKMLGALKLNKTTVANLHNSEMNGLRGGDESDPTLCFTKCLTNCDLCRTYPGNPECGFTKSPPCI